jgi:hypothetical protein
MLSKKQAKLIKKLAVNVPTRKQSYDKNTLDSISKQLEYLPYTDLYGTTQTIPICEEDIAFIRRESKTPTFYSRTCACGEKMVLMYDFKSGLTKEVKIDHPCARSPFKYSKFYSAESLKPCPEPSENDYVLIWDPIWSSSK